MSKRIRNRTRVPIAGFEMRKPRSPVGAEKTDILTVEEGPYGPRFVRDQTVVDRAPKAGSDTRRAA